MVTLNYDELDQSCLLHSEDGRRQDDLHEIPVSTGVINNELKSKLDAVMDA